MEEDKKKKRNKKKKNKQATNPTENVTRESTSNSQTRVPEIGQKNNGQVSGNIDEPSDVGGHTDADRDGNLANGTEGINLAEAEKQYRLDREASLQDKIKELQSEKDAQIQKEAVLEERIKQLLKEKDKISDNEASQKEKLKQLHDEKNASIQNEATLKEKLIQLEKEKDALIQKEGSLEQKVQQLEKELDGHLQKEASLEIQIQKLEGEKDSWVQKEVQFEEKINQLANETAFSNSNGVNLEEKVKQIERERDSWILKENSAKESIASLTDDNTKLRAQVVELEKSRDSLLEETHQLKETISSLQLQINNLENAARLSHSSVNNKVTSEDGDVNHQIEAARALVQNLMMENSELVEKVNELYAECDRRGVRTEHISSAGSMPGAVSAQSADITYGSAPMPDAAVGAVDRTRTAWAADSISEAGKTMSISNSTQSLEDVMLKDDMNASGVRGVGNYLEITEADEIVQIPLDEIEIKGINSEVAQNDEKTEVPITDAPLIGAPFRLISFVARYVSGADLVDKNAGK